MVFKKFFAISFLAEFLLLSLSPCVHSSDQNRVIIKKFDWKIYSTPHFDIYYYGDTEKWLATASNILENAYRKITADLNPGLDKRIPFFLYASINDMQQTPITDVGDGIGGLTEPYKDRFMVYSDGSMEWLKEVITHEFGHEVQFSILIDGFWESARVLKTYIYPLWMMEGIAEYGTGSDDIAVEKMYVRDAAVSGNLIPLTRLNQFAHLKPHQTTLAYKQGAQAIRFLAEQYGKDKPAKMLHLFRNRYDISSVLNALVGTDIFAFDRNFREYAALKYAYDVKAQGLKEPYSYGINLTGKERTIPEFNVSPRTDADGSVLAYITTRNGHPPAVCVRDLKTGKEKIVDGLDVGAENIPYGRFTKILSSLSVSRDGKFLVFAGQKNHREHLYLYDIGGNSFSRLEIPGFAEVRQPVFSPDAGKIAFVGMKDGFNDLYEFSLAPQAIKTGKVSMNLLKRLTDNPDDESSPFYSPDGSKIAYSCEVENQDVFERDICSVDIGSGKIEKLVSLDGSEYDPVFYPDGTKLMFVADRDEIFELYEKDVNSGEIRRLTRTIGGNFTPAYSSDGKKVYFSSFRNSSVEIYEAEAENFIYEKIQVPSMTAATPAQAAPASGMYAGGGSFKEHKFKFSTDLFFPAFIFSSPGGLYWMNYWQASDMLGNNNLGLFLNYNSGSSYLNYSVSYTFAKFRPALFFNASGVVSDDNLDEFNVEYDKRYFKYAFGVSYPFDRYDRMEVSVISKDDRNAYSSLEDENSRTRAVQISSIKDTVNGLYLTAVRGSRFEAGFLKAVETMGGNQKYDVYLVENLKYFPLSSRSALVFRILAGESLGRDKRSFGFGGLGNVRGFARNEDANQSSRLVLSNLEMRFPLFGDVNYYMWYMFPDFYFKSIFLKIFADSAFGWDTEDELKRFGISKIKSSVGIGMNVHTFILQAFHMVLSFDYAVNTKDGDHVFYFYLGPLF
ncbi:MAG: PD40 domain-containing protein [Elusimicrobia bacterium]|nr:PD40 domain-containing protein [Elusimicrobiota bacterium]